MSAPDCCALSALRIHSSSGNATRTHCARPGRRCLAFTLIEVLVVFAIVATLIGLLIPLAGMLRESARVQQATRCVAQLHLALATYLNEEPQRRLPPAEPDLFIRSARGSGAPHLINLLEAMGLTSNLQKLVADPADDRLRVLVDPWGRPYRYQPDVLATSGDPTSKAGTIRPDPGCLDWNARNLAPYDYVWSLGHPQQGHPTQFDNDPDAHAPNPAWIYVHTTVAASSGP